ncbi:melanopsin-like [Dendronephthya gigantea]|uniref:melanopsin-like n=1 Tax=Dendronephthya gigantea TaxID=151771 RepID=UPI00106C0444|nr:melanopsin-like [Dendronephthya gigantea]
MTNSLTMDNISRDNHSHSSKSTDHFVFFLSVCLVVIEILGLSCNGIILAVYYKYSRLRTATNLFILNLALCNLLLAFLQLMLSSPSFFKEEWLYGYDGCIAYGFLHQYLISVAVVTLGLIAFDRFCVITKPVHKLKTFIITKPRAKLFILLIHLYSLVFTFPLLVGWGELVPDSRYNTGCYIHYSEQSPSSLAYTVTSTLFACVLPFVVTACCYAKIYKSVRKSSRRCTLYKSNRSSIYKESCARRKSLYHTKTARMISIVMFFFLLTWLPTRIVELLTAFGCPVPPLAAYVCMFLTKSCVMYNAVVYVFLNHRFRAAFLHMTFVFRDDSRPRFNTSATTNASMRNLGEIFATSAGETKKTSRALSRKTLSQLCFVSAVEMPEYSSNVDLSRMSRNPTITRREESPHNRKSSCSDRDSALNDRELSGISRGNPKEHEGSRVESEAWEKDYGNGAYLNRGLDEEEPESGVENDRVGSRLPSVGEETNEADSGIAEASNETCLTAVELHSMSDSNPQHISPNNDSQISSDAFEKGKIDYSFNNPGLFQDDERSSGKSEERFENFLKLDINSLEDMI